MSNILINPSKAVGGGSPPPTSKEYGAHRYWRLNMSTSWGSFPDRLGITEVDWRTAAGSIDMSGATATSSAAFGGEPGTNGAEKTIDGNLTTFWANTGALGDYWLQYDMGVGNTMNPTRVDITSRADSQHNEQWPFYFEVQYSDDGTNWEHAFVIVTAENSAASATTYSYDFPPPNPTTNSRYFMVLSQSTDQGANTSMTELELLVSGADQSGTGTTNVPSGTASNLTDNNTSTIWTSTVVDSCPIWHDFGVGQTRLIDQVSITAEPSANENRTPRKGIFLVSDDGVIYYEVGRFYRATPWASAEKVTFTVDDNIPASVEFMVRKSNMTFDGSNFLTGWTDDVYPGDDDILTINGSGPTGSPDLGIYTYSSDVTNHWKINRQLFSWDNHFVALFDDRSEAHLFGAVLLDQDSAGSTYVGAAQNGSGSSPQGGSGFIDSWNINGFNYANTINRDQLWDNLGLELGLKDRYVMMTAANIQPGGVPGLFQYLQSTGWNPRVDLKGFAWFKNKADLGDVLMSLRKSGSLTQRTKDSHRYWRVWFPRESFGSGTAIALVELDFLDSGDVVLNGSGTPTASNEAFGAVGNAFDNDDGTFWASSGDYNHWIAYDFGAGTEVNVHKIRMKARSSPAAQAPLSCIVQFSDDNIFWTNKWGFSTGGSWSSLEERTFTYGVTANAAARYWRLLFLGALGNQNTITLNEVLLRGTAGGATLNPPWTVTASSGANPGNVDDGNTGTSWSNDGTTPISWLKFDAGIGNSEIVQEVLLRPNSHASFPSAFLLQRSSDDITYDTVAHLGRPGWNSLIFYTLDYYRFWV